MSTTGEADDTAAETTPRLGSETTAPRRLLAAATAVVALVHLVAGWRIAHPTVVYDENGYLGNARWIAGAGAGWEMAWSPRYAVGYPLVIAPLTRLVADPAWQWRAILALNAVLLAALVPLLFGVGRRLLGADRSTALIAAVLGALVPAALAAGPSAIAENLVLPLVPATILAFERALRPGPWRNRIWFGPAAALLYAAHPRFTVAVPIAVVALVAAAWRRWAERGIVATNGALLALGTALAWGLTRAVTEARWDHVERLEGSAGDVVRMASERSGLAELTWTLVGQLWYLAVGSLGLSILGVLLVVRTLRRGTGPPPEGPPVGTPARAALVVLVALAVAVLGVAVAFFAQNQFRADHYVYGRHNDSFTPIWVAAAAIALLRLDAATLRRWMLAAGAVIVGLFAVLGTVRDAEELGSEFSAFAVPALIRSVDAGPPGTFERATIAALVGLALIALGTLVLHRRRAVVAVVLVVSVWAGLGPIEGTDLFEDISYDRWHLPEQVAELGVEAIEVDGRGGAGFAGLAWPFHMPDVRFTTYEPALGEVPTETFVLARTEDEHLRAVGARIVLLDQGGHYTLIELEDGMALWVQPGPEQDRLEAEGRLLPAGFPTGLPETARRASLEIVDRPAVVRLPPGGSVSLRVRGAHEGTGSPWPDAASYDGPARVRIVAEITPLDGGPAGGRSGGELPRWTLPGDRFETEVQVFAVDAYLSPLPPGRYRVRLVVGQDQPAWAAGGGPATTFEMVVTG